MAFALPYLFSFEISLGYADSILFGGFALPFPVLFDGHESLSVLLPYGGGVIYAVRALFAALFCDWPLYVCLVAVFRRAPLVFSAFLLQ